MAIKTSAFSAAGATLGYNLGGSSTYTNLTQLISFDESGRAVAKIETTLLASTVKTSLPSIPDNGEVTFKAYDVPGDATNVELRTMLATPIVAAWRIQYPDGSSSTTGSTDVFSAYLTNLAPGGFAIDGTPILDLTLQITGAIVFTAGS
jgi:hypothetical protein